MNIGVLSDAHGNLLGLEPSLRALRTSGVERVYFLGDAVGYYPDGAEVLDLLDRSGAICVLGNHDAMLIGRLPVPPEKEEVYRIAETRARLGPGRLRRVEAWPVRLEISIAGRPSLLVHGSPWEELTGYLYEDSSLDQVSSLPFGMVVVGHTHRPWVRVLGKATVVNVGSSGMPRDHGGMASVAVIESDSGRAEIIRVPLEEEEIVRRYGARVHPSVLKVLARRPASATPPPPGARMSDE